MPLDALHKRKFKTNLAILFAIFAWAALIFIVAIIRMTPASSTPGQASAVVDPMLIPETNHSSP